MSDTIKQLGVIVGKALDDSPYYVSCKFRDKYSVFEALPTGADYCHLDLVNAATAESECDRLNNEYVAKKVIAAFKQMPHADCVCNNYNK